ncbi:putative outer membrane starch-binding protein [Chitinophaga dinghuensis]|uniref:Putative outer membrane starch-binding protein n=1 Tax=Chitinophaga dinghuensis TaxID=1539050 RepID=A0A327VZ10_9BACT|nr:RagB/SusD family nutrient uptake outer membrane protein [Chitinophaga dinghuensis]RAJ82219.1 putative outer membrane starch-binding protein [Chitinophaga dinghuensis]
MKRYIINCLVAVVVIAASSCNKFLDVKPETSVGVDEAYQTPEGFKQHLNGVYLQLAAKEAYGGIIYPVAAELLGQRYQQGDNVGTNYTYADVAGYNYTAAGPKALFNSIWSGLYKQIANLNMILQNIDAKKNIFDDKTFRMVKGEALALRTFCYFDLMRFYGPVYKTDSTAPAIPYYTHTTADPGAYLPAKQVMDSILRDGVRAYQLLDTSMDQDWGRMTHFGTAALLARMYLYRGDKENAFAKAMEVMSAQAVWWNFTKYTDVSKDPVLSGDALFTLQNTKLVDVFNSWFSPAIITPSRMLYANPNVLSTTYEGKTDDPRNSTYVWNVPAGSTITFKCFYKFQAAQRMPIIRGSECFLIAAETAANPADGWRYLNVVRGVRNTPMNTIGLLSDAIEKEYRKEFWGEGQIFFYYKRLFTASIPSGVVDGQKVSMTAKTYQVPVPDAESNIH